MRTKITILSAAALAAGILSSQAQVFSANIVGYVNQVNAGAYVSLANPLDKTGGNSITNLIDNSAGNWNGALIYVWNNTHFDTFQFDNGMSTGIANDLDTVAVVGPILNPGVGFFINNQSGNSNLITWVGQLHTPSGGPGSATNVISSAHLYTLAGSAIPFAGGITSSLQLTNKASALNGLLIYKPKISAAGAFQGYDVSQFDDGMATGFANDLDTLPVAEPTIPIGSGFFFNNGVGTTIQWVQTLLP